MIFAGIVLYNPEKERLRENVFALCKQVDKILLVDNASKNINEIIKIFEANQKIIIIQNSTNKGIAYALNQILEYAVDQDVEWFLTLDQDSVVKDGLLEMYTQYLNNSDVAMLTCNIEDRNVKVDITKPIEESNWNIKEVEKCITSGAYNNTKIIKSLGGFDNELFIDSVDFDMCYTIKKNGYRIIKVNYDGLLHEVGHTKVKKFFNKLERIYNHSSFRTYYMIRNSLYIIKKHRLEKIEYLKVFKRALLICLFQENKLSHIKAIGRGIIDSRKMGKLFNEN